MGVPRFTDCHSVWKRAVQQKSENIFFLFYQINEPAPENRFQWWFRKLKCDPRTPNRSFISLCESDIECLSSLHTLKKMFSQFERTGNKRTMNSDWHRPRCFIDSICKTSLNFRKDIQWNMWFTHCRYIIDLTRF